MFEGKVDARCREAQVRVEAEEDKRGQEEIWWVLLKYFQVEGGIHGQGASDGQLTGKNRNDPRDDIK